MPEWKIQRAGYAWTKDNALDRYDLAPDRVEMVDGKLYWSDEQRLTMIALLLENVGVDAVLRLGDPAIWREAVADL